MNDSTVTKADLVEEVVRVTELGRKESEAIVETIFESIIGALQGGDRIEIRGFGSFRTRQRRGRTGRNPKTGAKVDINDDGVVKVSASESSKIKAAVLVHHGEKDTRLASTWPDYDKALTEAKVPHEGYIYPDAVHGFNNDATPERYNKAAADQAWQRTIAWFNKYVRG